MRLQRRRVASLATAWLLSALVHGFAVAPAGADNVADYTAAKPDAAGIVLQRMAPADRLVVVLSGDGGWWGDLDTQLGARFAVQNDAVLGLDTSVMFRDEMTAAQWGARLGSLVDDALARTGATRVAMVGWSYGADVLPIGYVALPEATKGMVDAVVILAPRRHTDLEVTISGRLGLDTGAYALADSFAAIPPQRLGCLYPEGQSDSGCALVAEVGGEVRTLPGDHAFDHDTDGVFAAVSAMIARGEAASERTPAP